MPELRERHAPDLVIVNGENTAGGLGITEKTARELFDLGAGVITTGNHVYRHREAYDFLDRSRTRDQARELHGRESGARAHGGARRGPAARRSINLSGSRS